MRLRNVSSCAFTLIELLVSMAVFSLFLLLLSQVFTLSHQTLASNKKFLELSTETHAALNRLRDEMASVALATNSNRFLNFYAEETAAGVALYGCVPEERVESSSVNFVKHVCYFWDQTSSNIYRAVCENTSAVSNPNLLEQATLAYQSSNDPLAWVHHAQMRAAMDSAKTNAPLISNVAQFEARFYTNAPSSHAVFFRNAWSDPYALPRCARLSLAITPENSKTTNASRSFETMIFFRYAH